jgi:hypothetical protein
MFFPFVSLESFVSFVVKFLSNEQGSHSKLITSVWMRIS